MAPGSVCCTCGIRMSACVWPMGSVCSRGVSSPAGFVAAVSLADASVSSHHEIRWVKRIAVTVLGCIVPFGESC